MTRYGIGVPLMQPVGTLAVGEQQRIEILRLLYRKARILILDEPTAVLTPPEVEKLFIQLKNLAGEGRTILIVTHKLHELTALTDAITIMRAGRAIITVPTCEADVQKLAFLMVGERFHPVANSAQSAPHGSPVLSLRGLKLAPRFRNAACASRLDLDLYGGEIVGLAGVEGNGQSELIQALLDPAAHRHGDPHGSMHFAGEDMRRWPSRKVLAAGIAFVPPDRHHEGLLLHDDVVKNCALAWQRQRRFLRGPFLRWRALRKETKALLDEWQVSPPDAELGLHGFSGGNQQKILVGREMAGNPRLVIAAHPTRGVDIGAVQLIHRRLLDLKDAGATILLISSDLDEIRMLSDRIAVLENFRIVRIELARTWDETTLGLAMSGAPLMPGLGIEP